MKSQRRRLENELGLTVRRLRDTGFVVSPSALAGLGRGTDVGDLTDHIQALGLQQHDLAVRARLLQRLRDIQDALRRMSDGRYGICVECGARISAARLRFVPEAATCVRCQERIEARRRVLGAA